MQRQVVIDANVLVSGLLTHDPLSPLASIVDGMLVGRIRFLLSSRLLAEYREVLLRPRVQRRHGLT
ncbi:MAG: PIN domain-containing protein, partial [Caldilinea sp.]